MSTSLGGRLMRLLPPPPPPPPPGPPGPPGPPRPPGSDAARDGSDAATEAARDGAAGEAARVHAPPPRATMLFSTPAPPTGALPGKAGVRLERALFLDVETTGLSRGTGTLVFLIACGRLRPEGGVEVRLGLMREPAEEPDLLGWLTEELRGAEGIVTYNGASFDLPLLRTRFRLARRPDPFAGLPHQDLLPVCRRVFGRPARLRDLETRVLAVDRPGDVGGAEVARRYLRWLREGDGRPLGAVVRHAAMDVAGLARLAIRLGSPGQLSHGERAALAAAALAAGNAPRARALAHEALLLRPGRAVALQALWTLGEACRRGGDHHAAVRAHEAIVALAPADVRARVAAAIHYEHRARDFEAALAHAEAALTVAPEAARGPLERRAARLARRLAALAAR